MAKKTAPIKDKLNKTQILDQIAESTELSRKQVAAVLDSLTDIIEAHVKKNAVGEFVLPGLMKISTVRKPATKAHMGINPFTKEEVMFKAKPASTAIKVRPLISGGKRTRSSAESRYSGFARPPLTRTSPRRSRR